MPVFETFSKRKKKLAMAGAVDVYTYDELPMTLRVQIIHIWREALGPYLVRSEYDFDRSPSNNSAWEMIHDILCRELGRLSLGNDFGTPKDNCEQFIQDASTDHALDLIEVSFRLVDRLIRKMPPHERQLCGVELNPDEAINELNERFREHGLGYQFVEGNVARIDSEFVHENVVKSALRLIQAPGFQGSEDEFRKAHEHYRAGRNKEALNEALKALESTIKSICAVKGWEYPANATAKILIDLVFKQSLVSPELASHFSGLRALLEHGVPTMRNRQGGHGQGPEVKEVPGSIAGFAINSCASAIVFLVQVHQGQ